MEWDEFWSQFQLNRDDLFLDAKRRTRCHHRAEDLLQDTVFQAWKKIATLRERGAFRKWIFTIQYRVFVNGYRRGDFDLFSPLEVMPQDHRPTLSPDDPDGVLFATDPYYEAARRIDVMPLATRQTLVAYFASNGFRDKMRRMLQITPAQLDKRFQNLRDWLDGWRQKNPTDLLQDDEHAIGSLRPHIEHAFEELDALTTQVFGANWKDRRYEWVSNVQQKVPCEPVPSEMDEQRYRSASEPIIRNLAGVIGTPLSSADFAIGVRDKIQTEYSGISMRNWVPRRTIHPTAPWPSRVRKKEPLPKEPLAEASKWMHYSFLCDDDPACDEGPTWRVYAWRWLRCYAAHPTDRLDLFATTAYRRFALIPAVRQLMHGRADPITLGLLMADGEPPAVHASKEKIPKLVLS